MKHTKGPWTINVDTSGDRHLFDIRGIDNAQVAKLNNNLIHERQANAQLIAAAPEMLSLLKRANDLIANETQGNPSAEILYYSIRDLIAKAEGK